MLFFVYIEPLSTIIDSHSMMNHSYPDDLQLLMSASSDKISKLRHSMLSCISSIYAWETVNILKFNGTTTKLKLVTLTGTMHLHTLPTSITIGNA